MKQTLHQKVTALTEWFRRVQRPLPWRQTRDPYRIWVSEVMLQQTQVTTVLPYYARFLEAFPDIAQLAAAPEEQVLRLWSGLGYYSRARNLRRGARYLMENHQGQFPRDPVQALKVPGVGPYTAGAILSIAFDATEPIVDGNVQRVFARYHALEALLESKQARDFFWEKARQWVNAASSPRDLNQALMELGALVCTKAQPKCMSCPLNQTCKAHSQKNPERFPRRKPRRQAVRLWWLSVIREDRERIHLVQNPQGSWWSGLWDFPRVEAPSNQALQNRLRRSKREPAFKRQLGIHTHTVTHHRIHLTPIVLGWEKGPRPREGRWVTLEQARRLPLSGLAKKVLNAYEFGE